MAIAEVLRPLPVTPLPGAPAFVEGLIELRGRFLPVVDLRKRFGQPAPIDREQSKYIVAPVGSSEVAFVVDEVTGVERIPDSAIQPAPSLDQGPLAARFVSGIVKWEHRVMMMLDIASVLSEQEVEQLGSVR